MADRLKAEGETAEEDDVDNGLKAIDPQLRTGYGTAYNDSRPVSGKPGRRARRTLWRLLVTSLKSH